MTRATETTLLLAAAMLAAMGVALVNLAGVGGGIDARVGLTFFAFVVAFGSIQLAIRRWAPNATPYLFPTAAILTAVGFAEVYRLEVCPFQVRVIELGSASVSVREA